MFELLFSRPSAVERHRSAPLADERASYLKRLADQGTPASTLRRCAYCCRWLAHRIQAWPPQYLFQREDLAHLSAVWARRRTRRKRAVPLPSPKESFCAVAKGFLGTLGRLALAPEPAPGPYEDRVLDFLTAQCEQRGLSPETCGTRVRRIRKFLVYLIEEGCPLEDLRPEHVDAYFRHLALSWSRVSLRSAAVALRAWLRHCEAMGWVRAGLAGAVLVPRVYAHEGIPLGVTWDQVSRVIAASEGDKPSQLRARAVLLLLAVYGVRSGEVRRLGLDDIDWRRGRIRFLRSKSGRQDTFPLEPTVGDAIAQYLRRARPRSECRVLFLTLAAPFRPLSQGALYSLVDHRLSHVLASRKGRGPHAVRHACARRLVDSGFSLKEIGDHLGHRSAEATRIYAKVDLAALRLVALEDFGGLL